MIRAQDGSFLIGGHWLSNHLPEPELLSCDLPVRERLNTGNDNYHVYRIEGQVERRRTGAVLTFNKEKLEMVSISISLRDDESWKTWKPQDEAQRKALHETFLSQWLGAGPYQFPWGVVQSILDPRSGAAEIVIKYCNQH